MLRTFVPANTGEIMDIAEVKKGDFGLELSYVNNQLVFTVGVDSKGVDAGIKVAIDAEYFMDLLAKAIPGELDDMIINTIKAALKVVK